MTRQTTILLASGAAVVAIAGILGWLRPMATTNMASPTRSARWHLPDAPRLERSSAALSTAAAGVAWAGQGGAAAGQDVRWELLGLVGRLDDRAVLVKVGTDPLIKRVRSGDTLPDGSKLVSVGSDGIVIDREGCRSRRPLYATVQGDQPPPAGDCPPPGTD